MKTWAEGWQAVVDRATKPAVEWTAVEVDAEAAEMFEANWRPAAQGGAALFEDADGYFFSLGELFTDDYLAYAAAVWDRLIDVYVVMLTSNRARRRRTKKLLEKEDR